MKASWMWATSMRTSLAASIGALQVGQALELGIKSPIGRSYLSYQNNQGDHKMSEASSSEPRISHEIRTLSGDIEVVLETSMVNGLVQETKVVIDSGWVIDGTKRNKFCKELDQLLNKYRI